MALTVMLNSCKDEVEISSFSQTEMELLEPALLKDGAVVLVSQDYDSRPTYYNESESALEIEKYTILIGTSSNDLEELFAGYEFKPNTKYYWKLADTHSLHHDHRETDVRCFYYMEPYEVKAYYPCKGGDWAVVLKWDNNSAFEGGSVTMKPHKDCNYDKAPIEVPVGRIRATYRQAALVTRNIRYTITGGMRLMANTMSL